MLKSARAEIGIALYSPAKNSVFVMRKSGSVTEFQIPARRCGGHQAVTQVTRKGEISALELCTDGSFIVAKNENRADLPEEIFSSGALPTVLSGVRRGDLTRVFDSFGEAPVFFPPPGSDGTELLEPLPASNSDPSTASSPTPTPSPSQTPTETETPTVTPTETSTETPTYTPTPTPPPVPFIFTIDTTKTAAGSSESNQFKLPLVPVGIYNFTVDWGDGSSNQISAFDSPDVTHTYSAPGVYQVSILGRCQGWQFNSVGDRLKMKDIQQWGNSLWLIDPDQDLREYMHGDPSDVQAIEFAGGYIWTGINSSPGELIKLNRTTGATERIPLATGENQIRGLTTLNGSLFVPTMSGHLIQFDASSGARTASWDLSASTTELVDATHDGTNIWILARLPNPQIIKLNPSNGATSRYPLNGAKSGESIIYANNMLWVSTADGTTAAQIIRVDPSSGIADIASMASTIDIKGLAYDGSFIWGITGESPSKLVRLSPSTLEATVYTMSSGESAGTSLIFDGEWLWAGLNLGGKLGWTTQYVLKISPTNPNTRGLIRMTRPQSGVNGVSDLAFDGDSIWASAALTTPTYTYYSIISAVSKNAWSQGSHFAGCSNLNISASDAPDLSRLESLEYTFLNCSSLNADLSHWDVSEIIDFGGMLKGCTSFNNGENTRTNPATGRSGLGAWNTSKGEVFAFVFDGDSSFNRDISAWDLSKAVTIDGIFRSATTFTNGTNTETNPITGRQGIDGWDTGKVMNFNRTFQFAAAFNRPVANWDTSSGVDFFGIFYSATVFNQPLNSWNLGNAKYLGFFFTNAPAFNQPLNNWNISKNLSLHQTFKLATSFNQDINSWDTSSVLQMMETFDRSTFNRPLNNWNTSKVTSFSTMFARCPFNQDISSWNTSSATSLAYMFYVNSAFNNGDAGNNGSKPLPWNTSKVIYFTSMFYGATSFNQDISSWDTSSAENIQWLFYGASKFNNGEITNTATRPLNWNVSKATNLIGVFRGASTFNQDVGSWNVSAGTNLSDMFRDATLFNQNLSNWNMPNNTSLSAMFMNAANFNNGDPAGTSSKPLNWSSTSLVTTLASMFSGASRFNQDISGLNTSNVTSMASTLLNARMFDQNISSWNVSKVTSFNSMFNGAVSFKQDLSAWTPSAGTDFTSMFASMNLNAPGTTTNYDNFLLRLAAVNSQTARSLSGGLSRYSFSGLGSAASSTGRAFLTTATGASPAGRGWTIADGGSADCTFSSSSGLLATCSGDRPSISRVILKTTGTLPTGLTADTPYWTVRVSATTTRLATSRANAQSNVSIPFTDAGSGAHSMIPVGHVFTASSSSGSLLLTLTTGAELSISGHRVRFSSSETLPTGLSTGTDYWLNRVSATTYRVMSNPIDAIAGTNALSFSNAGSGTHELLFN